jgi:hypothetical protein
MLSMVSMDLQETLQGAFNLAANYLQLEPPKVYVSRDFDIDRLIGQDITALTTLFTQQVIDREEFRDILRHGEILSNGVSGLTMESVQEAQETPEEEVRKEEEEDSPQGISTDQVERLIQAMMG